MSNFQIKTKKFEDDFHRDKFNNLDDSWKIRNIEKRGAREKLILKHLNKEAWYLFKKPNHGKMEIYTEVFNSILANELNINHTQYFPARFKEQEGILCKSFLDEHKEEPFGLIEMKTLLCRHSQQPDLKEKKGKNIETLKEHNIQKIFNIMKAENYEDSILKSFFQMIGFDALIGHGDRHWCNYGFLKSKINKKNIKFAPIYDTSSGYLTEIQKHSELKEYLTVKLENDEWYTDQARIKGLCKITVPKDPISTHFELLKFIFTDTNMKDYKEAVSPAFNKYRPTMIQCILDEFFPDLEDIRKKVILKILDKRAQIGVKIIYGSK